MEFLTVNYLYFIYTCALSNTNRNLRLYKHFMSLKDFEGIKKFKVLILCFMIAVVAGSIIGPLFFYEHYQRLFLYVQSFYFLKGIYFLIMSALATYQGFKVLTRVAQNQRRTLNYPRNIYHAIILPIYQESPEILKNTLQQLASHEKAKSNYLVFLAMEQHSERPRERAQELIGCYQHSFKRINYTLHKLQSGQAPGKASNENFCLRNMEKVFRESSIDPAEVLYTTVDCDNLAPQVYFEEVEFFLSEHDWKMDNYLFGPQQMFTINNQKVPLLNRHTDFFLGLTVFTISNNITKVHNVASNYTISYNTVKKIGFLDSNPDAMCDDYHISNKSLWKTQGEIQIIPIYVFFNMVSLSTGGSVWQETKARFWQAERHMRGMLDSAYNFNMLFKNPFRLRNLWASLCFFDTHFMAIGCYMTATIFLIIKTACGYEFTPIQNIIFRFDAVATLLLTSLYFLLVKKSSKVLYGQKEGPSWGYFLQQLVLSKIIMFFFVAVPLLVATIRITIKTPTYEACVKKTQVEAPKKTA